MELRWHMPILGASLLCLHSVWAADIYSVTTKDGTLYLSNIETNDLKARAPTAQASINVTPADKTDPPHAVDTSKLPYDKIVRRVAHTYGVDSALLHAVISVESKYNPKAVSRRGAIGMMQLMPRTARHYGVTNLYDPAQNIRCGARYLRDLLDLFDGDVKLALAAYNAGETAVMRYGNRIPPFRETSEYVPRVLDIYRKYQTAQF